MNDDIDDVDDKRTDIAQSNRLRGHFDALKLTKANLIFLFLIVSVICFYIYVVLWGDIPFSQSSDDVREVPIATEPIPTASVVISTPLTKGTDRDVMLADAAVSARLDDEITSGEAGNGEGTRIITGFSAEGEDDSGVFNLDGLQPIDFYDPSLDGGVAVSESYFQGGDFDVGSGSPEKPPAVPERAPARGESYSIPEAWGSELKIISRSPAPQTYNRPKSSKKATSTKPSAEVVTAAVPVPVGDGSTLSALASQTSATEKIATGLYTRAYAINIHALNSDVSGTAILEIISQGPLKGSRLSASYERVQWTDLIRLRVTSLTLLSGQTVPVNAIVLDGETSLAAVSGDVDNHYLYRYGWWGFGSTLAGLGSGVESYASTSTISSGGVIETSADLNPTEKALVAFGSIGSEIGTVMQQNLQRPPTITLEPYQELGVFFLEDVLVTREP